MMFLHTLRLAGDLSFYYAFAGFFAASFGGTPMPLVLVWPALCFGLASCFEGSRPLRTTLAALSAAALLFLPTGADKLCYFPAAVYPVLLAYTGDFALSPVRQAERLRWLCRVWPFFAVAMLLWNANAVLSAALPFAMVAAVLLVGVQPHRPAGPGNLHPAGLSAAFRRRAGGGVAQGRSCSAAVLWLPVQRRLHLPFTLAGSCRCRSCF